MSKTSKTAAKSKAGRYSPPSSPEKAIRLYGNGRVLKASGKGGPNGKISRSALISDYLARVCTDASKAQRISEIEGALAPFGVKAVRRHIDDGIHLRGELLKRDDGAVYVRPEVLRAALASKPLLLSASAVGEVSAFAKLGKGKGKGKGKPAAK